MGLFICDSCGVIENTSLGRYWTKDSELWAEDSRGKALCSECAPLFFKSGNKAFKSTGKWHDRFEKKWPTEEDIESGMFVNR